MATTTRSDEQTIRRLASSITDHTEAGVESWRMTAAEHGDLGLVATIDRLGVERVAEILAGVDGASEATTTEPVTTSGWYQLTDGRVRRYEWVSGQLVERETVADWAAVAALRDAQEVR